MLRKSRNATLYFLQILGSEFTFQISLILNRVGYELNMLAIIGSVFKFQISEA